MESELSRFACGGQDKSYQGESEVYVFRGRKYLLGLS